LLPDSTKWIGVDSRDASVAAAADVARCH